jgi:L-threonylcarbamoyladenylate synthase
VSSASISDLRDRIAAVAAVLRAGGVVAYPTETFYGLGALAALPGAVARLAAAKLRPEGKALPLLAADVEQVRSVASLDDPLALRLAARFWPGPLTLVLPAAAGLDPALTEAGAVAVRVSGLEAARALAAEAGGALVATSANLSGEPPACRAQDLSATLVRRLDAVLDAGPTPGGLPSTIIAVERGSARLVREGAVPFDAVDAIARASR